MGDGGWEVGCNRWCGGWRALTHLLTHYLAGLDGLSRERSVLFGLIKLALEMEMEKEIYVYSQGVALCTYLPTYLMHNVGTSILLIFFLFFSFFFSFLFLFRKKVVHWLHWHYKNWNLTLQSNTIFFLQH